MKRLYLFAIPLILIPLVSIQSQTTTKQKFDSLDVASYSIETNSLIYNQGKKKNLISPDGESNATSSSRDKGKKYLNHIANVGEYESNSLTTYRNIEKFKDITLTGLAAIGTEVPLTSPIIDPLMKNVDYERQARIDKREKESINNVNAELVKGINEIITDGSPKDLITLIRSDNPKFEFTENGVKYNEKVIQVLDKYTEDERNKIKSLIDQQEKKINDLYTKDAEAIKEIARIEAQALNSYIENKEAIEKNKKSIKQNTSDIKENNRLIRQNALRTSILEATAINHELRISENTQRIENIELSMLWDRTSIEDKISGLESGKFDHLFKDKYGNIDNTAKQKLVEDSKNLKLRKDIAEGADYAKQWGQVASQLFSGIDPELSNAIDKGVQVADIVGNYATGNYAGAAMGVLSLAGIGGAKGPSQETLLLKKVLKEINALREEMRVEFQRVNEKLDLISKDIKGIREYLYAMNKDIRQMYYETQKELSIIKSKLDEHYLKLKEIDDRVNSLQLQGINICNLASSEIVSQKQRGKIRTYNELLKFANDYNCFNCITGLKNFATSFVTTTTVFDATDVNTTDSEVYNDLKELWIKRWSYENTNAFEAMFYPPKYLSRNKSVMSSLVLRNDISHREFNEIEINNNYFFEPLKSYSKLNRVSNYYLNLFPLIEIHEDDGFLSFDESLDKSFDSSDSYLTKFLSYLIDLVDYSLAQQSLMSGHLLISEFRAILLSDNQNDLKKLKNIFTNNVIILYNFLNKLISDNYDLIVHGGTLITLDKTKNLLIELDKSDSDIWKLKITKKYAISTGGTENLELPIYGVKPVTINNKSPEFILQEDFYNLLKLRQRLKEKLVELRFTGTLNNNDSDEEALTKNEFKELLKLN